MNFDPTTTAAEWTKPPLLGCYYLTGPTCSGKTPLAIELAKLLDAEILSLDSMAVYRGMDIGTAKPSLEQQQTVKHHLIDIAEPTEPFSVSCFVTAAHAAAAEIQSRGKRVLIAGGTPLFLKCLLRGLFVGPPADWDFRNLVNEDLKIHGPEALKHRLAQVDPLLAHRLHLHDSRRMIRGLEVARVTGRPLSHWQEQFENPAPRKRAPVAVLRLDRAWLHERINLRVEQMLEQGLLAEVEQLLARYGSLGHTAAQAVGYREILQRIQGELPAAETTDKIKAHTRQFARRQEIWFRGLKELEPLIVTPESQVSDMAQHLAKWFSEQMQPVQPADRI
jgi:tRNA dimethylallyltransferase